VKLMCGRFVLTTVMLGEPREFHPRHNIAPKQQIPVIVSGPTGSRV
jgi:putative SOS response-associated peptidase YedK